MRVVNEVRRGSYLDSVALMRIAATLRALPGIDEAGLMMGTPANLHILSEAGILAAEGRAAGPGDLVIALAGREAAALEDALATARQTLDRPRVLAAGVVQAQPRTLPSALRQLPGANLALVSVPGAFAAGEALKALRAGLNVLLFSDNVPLADEIALKREATARGLLLMGPDCGTAIVAGVPLGFANAVPRGDVGIVGASGTGIQEVTSLLALEGRGISHALGTGGRDVKAEVGGASMLAAIEALDADPGTRHIVVVSKPPAPDVLARVLARVEKSAKRFTICSIGRLPADVPANAHAVATHRDAVLDVLGRPLTARPPVPPPGPVRGHLVRGLFCGGTLAAEAQVVLLAAAQSGAHASAEGRARPVASNAPVPGALASEGAATPAGAHTLLDLGDDSFTAGRPHPMIDPSARDAPLAAALADPAVAVVLVDCLLGTGSHPDPAGHLARTLAGRPAAGPRIVASVTGTEADPQRRSSQIATLEAAGVLVAPSNADAAELAIACLRSE
jgi:FdrA protein